MVDYSEDFLQKLLDVKFGSAWMVIGADLKFPPSTAVTMTCTVDFPDQSAGTPGFRMITASVVDSLYKNPGYKPTLSEPIRTLAGGGHTGFGVGRFNIPSRGTRNAFLYLRMNTFPKSPFRCRVTYDTSDPLSGTGDLENFTVRTFRTFKSVRMTEPVPDGLGDQVGFLQLQTLSSDHHKVFDFRVNPTSLTIAEE